MGTSRHTTSRERDHGHDGEQGAVRGLSSVMNVGVRVAGRVPTRVDLRFAGTTEQQIGVSLGNVLIYLGSYLTARTVALAWGQAAPQARSLSPVLAERRRVSLGVGPWSIAAMVRLGGVPAIDASLLPAQAGCELPTLLRIRVGPITWEVADAAAYTSLLRAWRSAADLLAVHAGDRE